MHFTPTVLCCVTMPVSLLKAATSLKSLAVATPHFKSLINVDGKSTFHETEMRFYTWV